MAGLLYQNSWKYQPAKRRDLRGVGVDVRATLCHVLRRSNEPPTPTTTTTPTTPTPTRPPPPRLESRSINSFLFHLCILPNCFFPLAASQPRPQPPPRGSNFCSFSCFEHQRCAYLSFDTLFARPLAAKVCQPLLLLSNHLYRERRPSEMMMLTFKLLHFGVWPSNYISTKLVRILATYTTLA